MHNSMKKILKRTLNLLYLDSGKNYIQIAEELQVSRQTIAKYIKTLEHNCISSYDIIENPNSQSIRTFFIEIKTNPEEPEIVSKLLKIRSIKSIDGIIGANSLMVKFRVQNISEFNSVLHKIDNIISGSRFQHYRIIECLNTFKDGGRIFLAENPNRPSDFSAKTIKIKPEFIKNTDFPFKFYLQIMPKNLSEYTELAQNLLAPQANIIELYRTGQEFGIMAVIRTEDIIEYRNFIENLYKTGKLQDSITTFVIDEKMPAQFKPFKKI